MKFLFLKQASGVKKLCPICGAKATKRITGTIGSRFCVHENLENYALLENLVVHDFRGEGGTGAVSIMCRICETQGPPCQSEEDAILAWDNGNIRDGWLICDADPKIENSGGLCIDTGSRESM